MYGRFIACVDSAFQDFRFAGILTDYAICALGPIETFGSKTFALDDKLGRLNPTSGDCNKSLFFMDKNYSFIGIYPNPGNF